MLKKKKKNINVDEKAQYIHFHFADDGIMVG